MNITALRSNSKATLHFRYSGTAGKWVGNQYPASHLYHQVDYASNNAAKAFSPNVVWSNTATSTDTDKMQASVCFQWNLLKSIQQNILYEVLNP